MHRTSSLNWINGQIGGSVLSTESYLAFGMSSLLPLFSPYLDSFDSSVDEKKTRGQRNQSLRIVSSNFLSTQTSRLIQDNLAWRERREEEGEEGEGRKGHISESARRGAQQRSRSSGRKEREGETKRSETLNPFNRGAVTDARGQPGRSLS